MHFDATKLFLEKYYLWIKHKIYTYKNLDLPGKNEEE